MSIEIERFHPQYQELHAELLARPFPVVNGLVMVAHRAIAFTPAEAAEHRTAVAALANHPGAVKAPGTPSFQLLHINGARAH